MATTASAVSYTPVTLTAPPPSGGGYSPSAISYTPVTLTAPPPEGGFSPSAVAYATVTLTAPDVAPVWVSIDGQPWQPAIKLVSINGTAWA